MNNCPKSGHYIMISHNIGFWFYQHSWDETIVTYWWAQYKMKPHILFPSFRWCHQSNMAEKSSSSLNGLICKINSEKLKPIPVAAVSDVIKLLHIWLNKFFNWARTTFRWRLLIMVLSTWKTSYCWITKAHQYNQNTQAAEINCVVCWTLRSWRNFQKYYAPGTKWIKLVN